MNGKHSKFKRQKSVDSYILTYKRPLVWEFYEGIKSENGIYKKEKLWDN